MQKEKMFLAQLTVPMKRIHLGIRDNAVPFVHWKNIWIKRAIQPLPPKILLLKIIWKNV